MSTVKNKPKGSSLANRFPKLFGWLNDNNVDQAKLADFEKEADQALAASIEAGLENPEALADPTTETATEDDEVTKLKAEVAQLKQTNTGLATENANFKKAHKAQVDAGVVLPKEDAAALENQEQPQFAANSPMGIALARFKK